MLKNVKLLFLLLWIIDQKFVTAPRAGRPPPAFLPWPHWAGTIINKHLTNMTEEILKDTNLKLEQAKQIQMSYMFTMSYELGTITASIQGLFEHMLAVNNPVSEANEHLTNDLALNDYIYKAKYLAGWKIYREYSDIHNFVNKYYTLLSILKAYHVMQGDYNQIRVERKLFFQVLEKHKKSREKLRKKHFDGMKKGVGPNPNRNGAGAGARKRPEFRSNSRLLDQEDLWVNSLDDDQKAHTPMTKEVEPRLLENNAQNKKSAAAADDLPSRRAATKTTARKLWKPREDQFGGNSNF